MSEKNPSSNDRKLPGKRRNFDLDISTTNRATSVVNRPSVLMLHNDSDDNEQDHQIDLPVGDGREALQREQATAGRTPDANPQEDTTSTTASPARAPETDEELSESRSEEPPVEPRLFPLPEPYPFEVDDDFTIPQQDNAPPPLLETLATAHAVAMDEENQIRQEVHESAVGTDNALVAKAIYLEIDNEPQDFESDNEEQLDIEGVGDEVLVRGVGVEERADTIEAESTSAKKRRGAFVVGSVLLIVIIVSIAVRLATEKAKPQPTTQPTPEPLPGVWTQIGDDLVGEANGDESGRSIALSGDGGIVAVGAPENGGNGYRSGSVRVFQQNVDGSTTTWTRLGGDIDGANVEDYFGWSVSLSNDGTVLAVGAYLNDSNGFNSGQVRVLQLVNNDWRPIGDPINDRGSVDGFGDSVALSADGTIVAGGAAGDDYTLVYQFQNGNWNQLGSDIPGDVESVSLSHDGTVLAVGDWSNQVHIYRFVNNDWTIIGSRITGSGAFGNSVSLSADGRIVAIGAFSNDDNPSTDSNRGAAYVYQNINDNWIQVGSDLYGANEGDEFGRSVSLSNDGTVLAVGAYWNDSNGYRSGQVRVFQLVNNEWTRIGDPINGRGEFDYFGYSVALSANGTIVAGGAKSGNYALVHRLEEEQ